MKMELPPPVKLPVMTLEVLPKFMVPPLKVTLPVTSPPTVKVEPLARLIASAKISFELVAASKAAPLVIFISESDLVSPILPFVVDDPV